VDLIKEAITKAKSSAEPRHRRPGGDGTHVSGSPVWSISEVQLDAAHLEETRVVSFTRSDPSFVAFNMLRTNIYKVMRDNGWKGLAITSPTVGCGKTMVTVNLALSLARQPDCRTVVVDLDLKRPSIAKTLGVRSRTYIGEYLEGRGSLADCFVKTGDNLFFALNQYTMQNSSETLQDARVPAMINEIKKQLTPDIIIFDLPPMRAGDDAIGFMPSVETSLLVAAAGETTAADIQLCGEEIASRTNFLGVVLNKCKDMPKLYYY
jgi:capsular exopolysaccharide synthesis family protein